MLEVFDASGLPLTTQHSPLGNRYLWQGREYSWRTGLYYFRTRWYDPVTGRWLSNDPIGISGGLNQYVFCANNPVNFLDPFGLMLTDQQIANIVFNETRSLSGPNLHQARVNLANVIITGDWIEDNLGIKRPVTAPDTVGKVPEAEQPNYADAECATKEARNQRRTKGDDPTGGATHFNLRPNNSTDPFYGFPLRTQSGPFNNSYPQGGLPASGVYVNTYGDARMAMKTGHY